MPYYEVSGGGPESGDTDPHVEAATPEEASAKFLEGKPSDWTVFSVGEGTEPPSEEDAERMVEEQRDLTHGLAQGDPDIEVIKLTNESA